MFFFFYLLIDLESNQNFETNMFLLHVSRALIYRIPLSRFSNHPPRQLPLTKRVEKLSSISRQNKQRRANIRNAYIGVYLSRCSTRLCTRKHAYTYKTSPRLIITVPLKSLPFGDYLPAVIEPRLVSRARRRAIPEKPAAVSSQSFRGLRRRPKLATLLLFSSTRRPNEPNGKP